MPRDFAAKGGFTMTVGGALMISCIVAAAVMFHRGLASLTEAWVTPEYSHGPLIPLISTFLFLREMRRVPPTDEPPTDRWPGLAVVALGLMVGLVGVVASIDKIVTYGLIVWAAGVILISFGLRRGLLFWPAIVHLSFMLPLPQFFYWQTSTYLQAVSSQIGVAVISALGIPVYLDGNIIDLGVYKLQVAEACSGLRYLFPMLSFSFVFAVLYQGPRWHKLVLLAAAVPVTVLMNSFRIGVIGVLVNYHGIAQAEGFLHLFEGWVIFIACVLILFGLAIVLQRLSRDRRSLSETLDVEFVGLGDQLRRVRDVAPSVALQAALAITLLAGGVMAVSAKRSETLIERESFALFPFDLGGWSGSPGPRLDPGIEGVLAADDYMLVSYRRKADGAAVDLFSAFYHDQTTGGIHSPEVCIPGAGWEVSAWRQVMVAHPIDGTIEVNRAVIQKGAVRHLVYFWFELRGRRLASDYEAKFLAVWDRLRIGRSDGALMRLITPIEPAESVEAADRRLESFMMDALSVTPRFIPG